MPEKKRTKITESTVIIWLSVFIRKELTVIALSGLSPSCERKTRGTRRFPVLVVPELPADWRAYDRCIFGKEATPCLHPYFLQGFRRVLALSPSFMRSPSRARGYTEPRIGTPRPAYAHWGGCSIDDGERGRSVVAFRQKSQHDPMPNSSSCSSSVWLTLMCSIECIGRKGTKTLLSENPQVHSNESAVSDNGS